MDGKRVEGPSAERGVVFQEYALLPWMNVLDNAALGLKLRGVARDERYATARRYLAIANLHDVEHKYPHELSGGMKQRVAVARTLANSPEVMLMDEPFAAVDAQTRMTLQEELGRIAMRSKLTVIFITHSVEEAIFLGDRVAVMTPGPGRIRTIVDVPFAREARTWAALNADPAFAALREQLLGLVRLKSERDRRGAGVTLMTARAAHRHRCRRCGADRLVGRRLARGGAQARSARNACRRRAAATGSRSISRPSAFTSCACRKPAAWSRCAIARYS